MFVRTQFNTIVNLAKFQQITMEVGEVDDYIFYKIYAESKETIRENAGSLTTVSNSLTTVSKSVKLAQIRSDKEKAQKIYNQLFDALSQGCPTFDIMVILKQG